MGQPRSGPVAADAALGCVRCRRPLYIMICLLMLLLLVATWHTGATMVAVSSRPLKRAPAAALSVTQTPTTRAAPPALPPPAMAFHQALNLLRRSKKRYVIVEVQKGLGNRLRALASAMSVAAALGRSMLVVWTPDLHCNCSMRALFRDLPFEVLERPVPLEALPIKDFQVFNYMRGEPGAFKDETVDVDPDRHLYFKSAYVMNHPMGKWLSGGPQRQIQLLQPSLPVEQLLIADRNMVGLHVRNIFDAPRDTETNSSVEGASALKGAEAEYGKDVSGMLLKWRRASHWTNFVSRMHTLLWEDDSTRAAHNVSRPALSFYLAADSQEAYTGLLQTFRGKIHATMRTCSESRCDFRDCDAQVYALADMMNLARTRLILGSGYSSYSEVASHLGGSRGKPLTIYMAGRDFGQIVDPTSRKRHERHVAGRQAHQHAAVDASFVPKVMSVQNYWPKPF